MAFESLDLDLARSWIDTSRRRTGALGMRVMWDGLAERQVNLLPSDRVDAVCPILLYLAGILSC